MKEQKILCWCKNPEDGAIKQAENILKHPCLVGNVCLMPDTHEGYGMPIGGVVALENVYDLLIEYEKENGSNTHIERAMRIVEETLGEEVINCLKKNTKRNMQN